MCQKKPSWGSGLPPWWQLPLAIACGVFWYGLLMVIAYGLSFLVDMDQLVRRVFGN